MLPDENKQDTANTQIGLGVQTPEGVRGRVDALTRRSDGLTDTRFNANCHSYRHRVSAVISSSLIGQPGRKPTGQDPLYLQGVEMTYGDRPTLQHTVPAIERASPRSYNRGRMSCEN